MSKILGWAVLGTDGSFIDEIKWYREEHDARWGGHRDVKIVQVEIRLIKPKKRKRP